MRHIIVVGRTNVRSSSKVGVRTARPVEQSPTKSRNPAGNASHVKERMEKSDGESSKRKQNNW